MPIRELDRAISPSLPRGTAPRPLCTTRVPSASYTTYWRNAILFNDNFLNYRRLSDFSQHFQLLGKLESEIQVSISWPDLVVAGHLVPRGDRADGADTPGN